LPYGTSLGIQRFPGLSTRALWVQSPRPAPAETLPFQPSSNPQGTCDFCEAGPSYVSVFSITKIALPDEGLTRPSFNSYFFLQQEGTLLSGGYPFYLYGPPSSFMLFFFLSSGDYKLGSDGRLFSDAPRLLFPLGMGFNGFFFLEGWAFLVLCL